ncbi:NB-ARC domain-containing protein [Streptomyces sp. NPDC048430]|uniref:NB-ARC domain-containing protein n=1 Tax=Streptomyces sp. NPDC048430 TaxID=3155388 RepID=UPI00343C3906
MDFGTDPERQALKDLRHLLRELQAERGWDDSRVVRECNISKTTWRNYLGPDIGDGDRLPVHGTVVQILKGLGANQKQRAQAHDWMKDIHTWRERRRRPCVMLRPTPDIFLGRKRELDTMLTWMAPAAKTSRSATTLLGMGGAGKTALAKAAAYTAYDRGWFTGGVLLVDLQGFSRDNELTPSDVLEIFLHALDYRSTPWPATFAEKVASWNRVLTERANNGDRVLVLLDNVAHAQVQEIIPPLPHRTIITTRSKRSDLIAEPLTVAAMERTEAVKVLEAAVRAGTPDTRVSRDRATAGQICELAAGLPLALRILGALLHDEPHRELSSMLEELQDRRERLNALEHDPSGAALRASLELSYERLNQAEQRALHLLAAAPGPDISTDSARLLLGGSAPRRLLANLDRAHLLQSKSGERWQFHDLVRLYAEDIPPGSSSERDLPESLRQLFDHYLYRTAHASTRLTPHRAEATRAQLPGMATRPAFKAEEDALTWLDHECSNLVASAVADAGSGTELRRLLPTLLGPYLQTRRRHPEMLQLTEALIRDYPPGNGCPWDVELIHGQALMLNEQYRAAGRLLSMLLDKESTPPDAAAAALESLSVIARAINRPDDAVRLSGLGAAIATSEGDDIAEAYARHHAAHAEYDRGEWDNVLTLLDGVLGQFASQSLHREEAEARLLRAKALRKLDNRDEAVAELAKVTLAQDPLSAAQAHVVLAFTFCDQLECTTARKHWSKAAAIYRRANMPCDEGLVLGLRACCLVQAGDREAGTEAAKAVLKKFGKYGEAATGTAVLALSYAESQVDEHGPPNVVQKQ